MPGQPRSSNRSDDQGPFEILRNSSVPFFLLAPDGIVREFNLTFSGIVGDEGITGRQIEKVVEFDLKGDSLKTMLDAGKPFKLVAKTFCDPPQWLRIQLDPVELELGGVGWIGCCFELDRYQQLVQMKQLVDSCPDAIISKNLDGKILSWNRGAQLIYGFRPKEAIGRKLEELMPRINVRQEQYMLDEIRRGRLVEQLQTRRFPSHGDACDVSVTAAPILDRRDEVIGVAVIERDISDQRRATNELIKAKSKAEEAESRALAANKSRGEFLANVSHELRTPMNAILGMIELAMDEEISPLIDDYLKTARSSAYSLLELVDELLDFSKIEAGKFEIQPHPFSIADTIDSVGKELSPRAAEKGLELFCDLDSHIPRSLVGDQRRIKQVLANLVSNAIKFTEIGEVVVKAQYLGDQEQGVCLRMSVADTGIGIAPEDQARIFAPFAQADMSATRKHHGTGLGLSICQEILEMMGSNLELESTPDEGSCFSFQLCLPVDTDFQEGFDAPTELVQNMRVLLVDDNETHLRILHRLFESWNMNPIAAHGSDAAVALLDQLASEQKTVDLVVVDGMMPGKDGFDLVTEVASTARWGHPKTIIMQSDTDKSLFSDRLEDSPAEAVVTKPISQSELLNAVVESLDLYVPQKRDESNRDEESILVKTLNVLLVEDLLANQKVAKAILEKRGHRVTVVNNGKAAISTLYDAEDRFDVVLMDVQMPVMDGLQATREIRATQDQAFSSIPIVAMTANAMRKDRDECFEAGMNAYLSKPLDAKKLIRKTERAARLRSTRQDGEPEPTLTIESTDPFADGKWMTKQLDHDAAMQRLGGDKELFQEFISIFQEDIPGLFRQLEEAVGKGQPEQIQKTAHALKGLVSNFGAKECVDAALKLERAGKLNQLADTDADLIMLKAYLDQLTQELQAFDG